MNKHYIDEITASKFYEMGYDVFVETVTVIKVDHSNSDNMDDMKNVSISEESRSRFYVDIEDVLN